MNDLHRRGNDFQNSCANSGCNILMDGWTNTNGHEMINVLVDSL